MCIYTCLLYFFNLIEKLKQSLSVDSKEAVAWFLLFPFSPPPLLSPLNERTWTYSKAKKKSFQEPKLTFSPLRPLKRGGGCQSDSSPRRKRRRRRRRRRKGNMLEYYAQMQQKHIQSQVGKKGEEFHLISGPFIFKLSFFLFFSRTFFWEGKQPDVWRTVLFQEAKNYRVSASSIVTARAHLFHPLGDAAQREKRRIFPRYRLHTYFDSSFSYAAVFFRG